jgi:pimeloyl-ACP methyl ester carboxylesterase
MVDDVLALLDALELDRVLLIGHDIGGRIGFHLCMGAPSRVLGFVALNALHPYWSVRRLAPHAWRYWWTVVVETPLLGRTILRRVPAYTRLLFRLGAGDRRARSGPDIDEFLAALREPARAAERLQGDFAYREIVPALFGRHRARMAVPTLMLNGTRDFALCARQLGGHERYADDLRVELVPAGGHFLHEERPNLVASMALAHFRSLAASSTVGSTPKTRILDREAPAPAADGDDDACGVGEAGAQRD